MKRLTFLTLITLLGHLILWSQTTSSPRVELYLDSVALNMPEIEKMTLSEKIILTADIIDYELNDTPHFNFIQQFSAEIPELIPLINRQSDPLRQKLRTAARSLYEYSLNQEDCDPQAIARAGAAWLTIEAEYRDTAADFESLINTLKSRQASAESICMAQTLALQARIESHICPYPNDWLDIYAIEQQAQTIFPTDSPDASAEKLITYRSLAILKELPAQAPEDELTAILLATPFDTLSPREDGTDGMHIGQRHDYLCNSIWYLDRCEEMASHIYGASHPASILSRLLRESFYSRNFEFTEDLSQSILESCSYIKDYWPEKALHHISAAYFTDWINLLYNQSTDTQIQKQYIEAYRDIYGSDNFRFFNAAISPAFLSALKMKEGHLSYQNYQHPLYHLIQEIKDSPSLKKSEKNIILFNIYNQCYALDPDSFKYDIDLLRFEIDSYKNPSFEDAWLAGIMMDYYFRSRFDNLLAVNLSSTRRTIIFRLFGACSPLFYQQLLITAYLAAESGNKDVIKSEFKYAEDIFKDVDEKYRDYCNRQILDIKSRHAFFIEGNFEKTCSLIEKTLKVPGWSHDEILNLKCIHALALLYLNRQNSNLDEWIAEAFESEQAKPAILKDLNTLQAIWIYFSDTKRFEEALKVAQAALETYTAISGSTSDSKYLQLRQKLCLSYADSGDLNSAKRILGEDIDIIDQLIVSAPSFSLLDYLWLGLNFARQDSYDLPKVNYYFSRIMPLTASLYQSASDKDYMNAKYMIPAITVSIDLLPRFKFIIKQEEEKFGTDHPSVVRMKTQYNQLLSQFGGWIEDSEILFPKKPKMNEIASLRNHLIAKAGYYFHCHNNTAKAEACINHALKICSEPWQKISVYSSAAFLYRDMGLNKKSLQAIDKFTELCKQTDTNSFDSEITTAEFYFNHYANVNDFENAEVHARQYFSIIKKQLDTHFQLMTNADQDNFMNRYGDPAGPLASILEYNPKKLAPEVYDAVVYRTGMQLRSQSATRRAIESSTDPSLLLLTDSLASVQAKYKRLTNEDNDTKRSIEISSINRQIDRLEQQILDLTLDARKDAARSVTWQMIRDCLHPGEAAIEFIHSDLHITALILTPNCPAPQYVALCSHTRLQDYLKSFDTQRSSAIAKKLYADPESPLYNMLWAPIENYLDGVHDVYITSPGVLNNISFNAIADPSGKYIFDRYRLHQLTTTAELLTEPDNTTPKSATLIGDIFFSPSQEKLCLNPESAQREIDESFGIDDFEERGISRTYFQYLPFTASEIDNIHSILNLKDKITIRHHDASEENVRKSLADNSELIHLATHGFFIADEKAARAVPFLQRFPQTIGLSMQRAGIALAGAEEAWKGADLPEYRDGILTASEVANLNLAGTKLVALSACETALGSYSFEGVFGLSRGLKQAGVKSMLLSLWSVNDHSTSLFMSQFYKEWISSGNRYEAYRNAIKFVREQYPAPFNWAPFVLLD